MLGKKVYRNESSHVATLRVVLMTLTKFRTGSIAVYCLRVNDPSGRPLQLRRGLELDSIYAL